MAIPEAHAHLTQSTILVTGGSGGLASRILQLFAERGSKHLHSLDLRPPSHPLPGVNYHTGDLTDTSTMQPLLKQIQPTVVIHTASPKFDSPNRALYKVNVEGTRTILQIARESGTQCFVYTSSASVISDAQTDLINAEETYPVLLEETQQPEYYVYTKALAESYVLSQNQRRGAKQFLTCAIRPSGIFGVGDLVVLPGILGAYFRGRTKWQIGENRNRFDFTENTNVAHAHYLAAAALLDQVYGLGHYDSPEDEEKTKIDGEAFFITNDEPRYFWDFTRLVWGFAGDTTRPEQVWVIPRSWALRLAGCLEWVFWGLRLGEPPLTRTKVRLSCMTRYFCIDKAKSRLGYRPVVGLEEGLQRAVEDCMGRRAAGDLKIA
ncbi:C-3 sterol dehydrogenase/C-4 decarboxylase family protein [Aspergillus homomorphus CBS 101889]|uniref:C-3 sterol dehydrogenase/C-4 decarboxylase family protein n=1 Tax=Aspergillus homomorphus (strain CBS 101889) TaxID=1450537 RepID=A0A395HWP6_ASPHC|nr:C-3 sterol dehydrogenase/C-4 decarboxylase family protein [Aspergillus homomorphus CBS 101889]RAL11845.1 C-3 sterol dehydrogenase/C-4 decarboxylase family protein [Aspergillus homomorphus CBS 101889]